MNQTRAESGGVGVNRAARYAALLSEQESSGMSVRAFALARGLSPLTLYVWRRKLGRARRRGGVLSSGLVAVDVIERGGADALSSNGFEVSLANSHRVHVPERFDAAVLAQLLTVLRAC